MKIDFSDIFSIESSYLRQIDLISAAIVESESKHELEKQKMLIDIAAIDCRNRIIIDMAEETAKKFTELYAATDIEVLKHADATIN